ncbi:rhomboid family intramembrane serine protease [Phaeobacter sp. J2-8]|uniref:rhomboid family intramembrane serine protease n=1 Tax=Phaeobacter sp. J2-8 TaxID=2931394 RepID=UPI001FD4B200|nr:rhomboid family intramembrane serine protease [Phaeobacter sp. J2-8]MCJ7871339.1 rhomboid family intramembrane serine protease [Phaeobacter sp. J2-8]
MHDPMNQPPINPLPPVIVALFLVIAGIELTFQAGAQGFVGGPTAVGWRLDAVRTYAFSGDIFDWMLANGVFPLEHMIRFVSYPFLQANFSHALFVSVMLLALGKWVGEVMGGVRVLVLFLGSSIIGAVFYGAVLNDPVPLIGGFPGVYGIIGGFTLLLWRQLGAEGGQQMRAFSLIGMLLAIRLVFSLLYGADSTWAADFAGFVGGFAMSILLAPGGWTAFLARIRR